MRMIIWLLLVSMVAVLSATVLGANDGLVTIFWSSWRVDFSLNFFLLLLGLALFLSYLLIAGFDDLRKLPNQAKQWRANQSSKAAQSALREAISLYLAARYARASKEAQKAIRIQSESNEAKHPANLTALSYMLSATSLHRLRDRKKRDDHLQQALELARSSDELKPLEEGVYLLRAEFAIDDHMPERALQELASLPAGVARRTQALRLKLNAARMANQPLEALRTARLLAKHQGFSASVAENLLRSLVQNFLNASRDKEQLLTAWQQLEKHEQTDPFIASDAAVLMTQFGQPDIARSWLMPLLHGIENQNPDVTQAITHALRASLSGLEAHWLPLLDKAEQSAYRVPSLALCLGLAFKERQLWGKAKIFLLSAANDLSLSKDGQRMAWTGLAELAEIEQISEASVKYWKAAATLERPSK